MNRRNLIAAVIALQLPVPVVARVPSFGERWLFGKPPIVRTEGIHRMYHEGRLIWTSKGGYVDDWKQQVESWRSQR